MFKISPIKKPSEDPVLRNPFSGVTIQPGTPVDLPKILPQEAQPVFNVVPVAQPATPAFNPNAPSPLDSPNFAINQANVAQNEARLNMEPIDRARVDYEAALQAPAQKQGLGKQILFQVLQAVGNVATGQNKPIEMLGNAKKRFQVEQAKGVLEPLQQQRKIQQEADLADAKIADIPFDNEIKRQTVENNRILGQDRLKNSALSKLNTLKTFDPKNNAHRRLAEMAELNPDEIGAWDTRNPIEHSINGVRFRLNRETGKYEQTDLPVDEEKQLVDFKTKDGKTYRVSAKTAATLQTQFDTLGIKMEQQERQFQQKFKLDVAKFNQAKKQYEESVSHRNRVFDALQQARATKNDADIQRYEQELRDYDLKLQTMLERALKAKNDGELDDAQFNDIQDYVNKNRKQ